MKIFTIKSILALAATVLFTSTVYAGFTSFQAQPNSVFVNTPTQVAFIAVIAPAPSLIKQSVKLLRQTPSGWVAVGTMHDDGLLGGWWKRNFSRSNCFTRNCSKCCSCSLLIKLLLNTF